MSIVWTFLGCLVVSILVMSVAFVISRRINRVSLIDVAWGLNCICIGIAALLLNHTYTGAAALATGLVAVWGLRLASHLLPRVIRSESDDKRYVELIKKWNTPHEGVMIYFRIFLVQAILGCIIMTPVIVMASGGHVEFTSIVIGGALIWIAGFMIESIADYQLRQFIRENPGKLMTSGLWRYSRHPNYFGEVTQWTGVGLIALAAPYGVIGLIGPITIALLLLLVSGVPLAEKAMAQKSGWSAYRLRTSIFIPLPPRS